MGNNSFAPLPSNSSWFDFVCDIVGKASIDELRMVFRGRPAPFFSTHFYLTKQSWLNESKRVTKTLNVAKVKLLTLSTNPTAWLCWLVSSRYRGATLRKTAVWSVRGLAIGCQVESGRPSETLSLVLSLALSQSREPPMCHPQTVCHRRPRLRRDTRVGEVGKQHHRYSSQPWTVKLTFVLREAALYIATANYHPSSRS